jgi:hypothetical protein
MQPSWFIDVITVGRAARLQSVPTGPVWHVGFSFQTNKKQAPPPEPLKPLFKVSHFLILEGSTSKLNARDLADFSIGQKWNEVRITFSAIWRKLPSLASYGKNYTSITS